LPASAISVAATSPASPPPTTITSASSAIAFLPQPVLIQDRVGAHGQRQTALACGGCASKGIVNLFQFGTFRPQTAARAQHLI
jgi:hypothetical protein